MSSKTYVFKMHAIAIMTVFCTVAANAQIRPGVTPTEHISSAGEQMEQAGYRLISKGEFAQGRKILGKALELYQQGSDSMDDFHRKSLQAVLAQYDWRFADNISLFLEDYNLRLHQTIPGSKSEKDVYVGNAFLPRLMMAYLQKGQLREARDLFIKRAEADNRDSSTPPKDLPAYRSGTRQAVEATALMMLDPTVFGLSNSYVEMAYKLCPSNGLIALTYARLCMEKKDYKLAIKALNTALTYREVFRDGVKQDIAYCKEQIAEQAKNP